MDHALRVGFPERARHLSRDRERLGLRQGPALAQQRRERGAVDEVHDQEREAVLLGEVADADDVAVGDASADAGLVAETPQDVLVRDAVGAEDLERHLLAEVLVDGAVDGAGAALADQVDDPIAAGQELAGGELRAPRRR